MSVLDIWVWKVRGAGSHAPGILHRASVRLVLPSREIRGKDRLGRGRSFAAEGEEDSQGWESQGIMLVAQISQGRRAVFSWPSGVRG